MPGTRRLRGQELVDRAAQVVAGYRYAPADWPAVSTVLRGRGRDAAVVRAALRHLLVCAQWRHYLIHEDADAPTLEQLDQHLRDFGRSNLALTDSLRRRAVLGAGRRRDTPRPPRRVLRQQAHKIEQALVAADAYGAERIAALGEHVRLTLGLVQHVVSGRSLPAVCSSGGDW